MWLPGLQTEEEQAEKEKAVTDRLRQTKSFMQRAHTQTLKLMHHFFKGVSISRRCCILFRDSAALKRKFFQVQT